MATDTQAVERRLARTGYRMTSPRRRLLTAIDDLGDHFTAEQLAHVSPGVGRATVFRTLRLLQDIGSLCQVVLDDGTIQYRLAAGGHHHHVVCSQCGRVTDVSNCDIATLLDEVSMRTGYEVDSHRLEIYGRCSDCQARVRR